MSKASDIYSYKPGKSANEEVHLLNGKGRITLLMFWERLLVIGSFALFVNLILEMLMEGEEPLFTYAFNGIQYDGMYTLQWLTYLLFAFALNVQSIKRAHDCNMTGILGLINPIIYFKRGTIGDNDHGKDPFPLPKVQYFDEYEELKDKNEFQVRRKYMRTIPAFFSSFALLIYATDSYYSDHRTIPDSEAKTNGKIDTNVYMIDSMSISDETDENHTSKKKDNGNNELNEYSYCKIGDALWMSENLKVDRFANGEKIVHAKTNIEWMQAMKKKIPAWCIYENDADNESMYGKLYNWYAVNDPRGLAPKGWHIPTSNEWMKMLQMSGGEKYAGKMLKGDKGWMIEQKYGKKSLFKACPGGFRNAYDGSFENIGYYGYWWTSDSKTNDKARNRGMEYDIDSVNRGVYFKGGGFSVRCIKN